MSYTKPNGKSTKSARAYCLAWRREINLPLEKHYGLTVIAFDPDVRVFAQGQKSNSADIPLWLARRMIAMAETASTFAPNKPKLGTNKPKVGG